ncbi:MAG: hypothetical protein ACK5T0_06745 [Vampirovibrionales bacterium]
MTVDQAVASLKSEGKQMKDEDGNSYTYVDTIAFKASLDSPKLTPKKDRAWFMGEEQPRIDREYNSSKNDQA